MTRADIKAEPPSMPQGKSLALLDLDSVEHMQGGANGRGRLELPTNGLKVPGAGGAV